MQPHHEFIVIEGNIGAGKSSLATKLSHTYQSRLILEEFEDNSFLPKFYEDHRRFAFPLEMSFLAARFNQLKRDLLTENLFKPTIVSDYMFAKCLLFSRVNLDEDEYDLYLKLFDIINLQLRQPDLIVYLHNPIEKLKWNIANRGRSYEQNISDDYLQNLHDAYMNYWQTITHIPILIMDCSAIDFVNNENDYENMLAMISKSYTPGIHYINWLK
jgi:deoxyadenosine/deoxycytidine kinase